MALVASCTGTQRSGITTTTKLAEDLGMDGDDAVEFFEAFGSQFNVDLEELYSHWSEHFGAEGTPASIVLILVGGGALIGGAFAIGAALGVLALLLMTIGAMAYFGGRRMQPPSTPITISDLILAEQKGSWPLRYD